MSWLDRLRGGFAKTAEKVADNLTGLTSRAALDTATLDDIEEALIASDLGPEASRRIREAIAVTASDAHSQDLAAVPADRNRCEIVGVPLAAILNEDSLLGANQAVEPPPPTTGSSVAQPGGAGLHHFAG